MSSLSSVKDVTSPSAIIRNSSSPGFTNSSPRDRKKTRRPVDEKTCRPTATKARRPAACPRDPETKNKE